VDLEAAGDPDDAGLTLLCVVKGHFKIEFFLGSAEAGPVVAVSSPVLDGAVGSGGGEAWVRGASR
jgi:hypothetical protein